MYGEAVAKKAKMPKKKCCVSKPRCKRCPIQMLKDGTLPEGYTVKKRKLVKVPKGKSPTSTKSGKKLAAA